MPILPLPKVFTISAFLIYLTWRSVSASGASSTLFGRSDYHHEISLDTTFSPLESIATFDLEQDGTFEISVDIEFTMNTAQDDANRVMLYLVACDEVSTAAFLDLPSQNSTSVPSYCAMANRTLDYYCQSFPLQNQSPKSLLYQSVTKVSGSVGNATTESNYARLVGSNSTTLNFFIDACELLGGNEGILRSCLTDPPPTGNTSGDCFYCLANYPNRSEAQDDLWRKQCVVPPTVERAVRGTVAMNLCTANGNCMWERDYYVIWFYGVSILLWGGGYLVWMWHIHTASPGTAVDLHYEMSSVAVVQTVYNALAFAANYTAGEFASPKFNVIANIALIAQILSLIHTTETILRVAAGWKVTLFSLDKRDVYRIHCVVTLWAMTFVVVKQLGIEYIAIIVFWGISWFSILILVHFYSTVSLKMLRKRFSIGQQLNIDTSSVMWKGTLFLQFRRLQKTYVFVATVTALCGADSRWLIWRWISVRGHETLNFLFYASLAYICRCQQFRFRDTDNLQITVEVDPESNNPADTEPVNSASVIPVIEESLKKKLSTALILHPDKSVVLGATYTTIKPEEPANESSNS